VEFKKDNLDTITPLERKKTIFENASIYKSSEISFEDEEKAPQKILYCDFFYLKSKTI
jgi:hypothetical protein